MAVEKIVNVTIKDNAADVEKDINKLNKSGENLESTFKDVNHTFEEVYGDLKPLTTRLGEAEDRMYELALAGKQNTEEYRELLKATANYRQVQIQTDLVVDTAAQTMSQKLGGALEGAASGFALVQGAMGLFGTESEEVEKALLKVQSAMALAQGVEGVRTAIPLFKSFGGVIKNAVVGAFTTLRGAIISTGIGALVVALGMAADAMGLFGGATEDAAETQEELNAELEKTVELTERYNELGIGGLADRRKEIELLKAKGATIKEIYEAEKDLINEQIASLEDLKSTTTDNEKFLQYQSNIRNLYKDLEILDIEYTKSLEDQEAERKEGKDVQKQIDIERAKERAKQLEEIERQRLINIQQLEQDFLAEIEGVESEYFDSLLSDQEREVRAVEDKYFRLLNKAQEYNDALTEEEQNKRINTLILEKAQKDELSKINQKYRDSEKEANKKAGDEEKANTEEVQNVKFDLINKNLANISNLLGLFRVENEKDAKKQFEVNKALSLAQASIQTFQAVTGALTAGGNPIKLATGAQFVEAGIAAAIGAANIAKIAKTKFKGADISASSGGSSITSASTQQLSSPNFNVVGATGISQTEELQPVKAYVVSGDVTTAQALDRNRIQNATF